MKHTLIALVRDHPGVLNRAVSVFRRRGLGIDSLTVAPTDVAGVSRMTIVADVADIDRVLRQFARLLEVLEVSDTAAEDRVERETVLVKVAAPSSRLDDLTSFALAYGATVADVTASAMVMELTDTPRAVSLFVEDARQFGILETMRSGPVVLMRGDGRGDGRGGRRPAGSGWAPIPAPGRPNGESPAGGETTAPPASFHWQADGVSDDAAA